jgi:hypothetical protein
MSPISQYCKAYVSLLDQAFLLVRVVVFEEKPERGYAKLFMAQLSLLIIDDFYLDPAALRRQALQMDYSSKALHLPAARSVETIIPPEVTQIFQSSLGVDLMKAAKRIPLNGCFQLMLTKDQAHSYVHADQSAQWAAIIYLSQTPPREGTLFYQHKLTGLTSLPEGPELNQKAKELGLLPDELKLLLREDRKNKKKWIETDQVEFRWNRFILYNAQLFHSNGKTWGSSITTGRLTHNFFV